MTGLEEHFTTKDVLDAWRALERLDLIENHEIRGALEPPAASSWSGWWNW